MTKEHPPESPGSLPVLRIFLSSTAIDLQEHRRKVADAVLRLGELPVAMETFGARPAEPVAVCQAHARDCDALVVVVAHRYGWQPTEAQGGDGTKSITRLEVEAALAAGRPVFAFLVDPDHPWPHAKEQDLLAQAEGETAALGVFRKVQALNDFRAFLEGKAGLVRELFTTPDDLATKVATSLAGWQRRTAATPAERARRPARQLRMVHPLQPAPHFRGRQRLLGDLAAWWRDPASPDRVRSLVALGGAGKTAVAERLLASVRGEPLRASLLVWSFYEDPNTDAFLREACDLFAGEAGEGAGGRLERLQRALAGGEPHLMVLDGLERVQAPGSGGRARGELEDHALKNLLRSLASGLGHARALITSRFHLADLAPWEGAGYRSHSLDALDPEAARGVLTAWGVRGGDARLDHLAGSVGRHALSISVLGSYLHHVHDGDPEGAPPLDLEEQSVDDPQAAKLGRILGAYATELPEAERDLLVRLSLFPRGVSVETLEYLIDAGGEVAGALVDAGEPRLTQLAARLSERGLAFSYKRSEQRTYTAHPFLRDYFGALLGFSETTIHEAVRTRLASRLTTRPGFSSLTQSQVESYQVLIEETILAGAIREAFEIWNAMGGLDQLGSAMGDYGRCSEILNFFFSPTDNSPAEKLAVEERSELTLELGISNATLGNFTFAEDLLRKVVELQHHTDEFLDWQRSKLLPASYYELGKIYLHRAEYRRSTELLAKANSEARSYEDDFLHALAWTWQAIGHHYLGEEKEAKWFFEMAKAMIYPVPTPWAAEYCLDRGEVSMGIYLADDYLKFVVGMQEFNEKAHAELLLGLLKVEIDPGAAHEHLTEARSWTSRSGQVDCVLRSHLLAARIARKVRNLPGALNEANSGLILAEGSGFRRLSIDLLLELARIQLAVPDPLAALRRAREALDRAQSPECQGAWHQADALHLCGQAHLALGERDHARGRFEEALAVRERIEHPGANETRAELAKLAGTA